MAAEAMAVWYELLLRLVSGGADQALRNPSCAYERLGRGACIGPFWQPGAAARPLPRSNGCCDREITFCESAVGWRAREQLREDIEKFVSRNTPSQLTSKKYVSG